MSLDHIVPVLQLSISPAIVISGAGLVLLSMTNRFGRVIDRTRSLAESLRQIPGNETHRIQEQLVILIRRTQLLRMAIAFASSSLLLAAFLVIVLFIAALLNIEATSIVIVAFISCMGSLITGLIFFLADVNASLSALKLEIDMGIHPAQRKK